MNMAPATIRYQAATDQAMRILGELGGEGQRISPDILKNQRSALPGITDSLETAKDKFDSLERLAVNHFTGRSAAKGAVLGVGKPPPIEPPAQGTAPAPVPTLEERRNKFLRGE